MYVPGVVVRTSPRAQSVFLPPIERDKNITSLLQNSGEDKKLKKIGGGEKKSYLKWGGMREILEARMKIRRKKGGKNKKSKRTSWEVFLSPMFF